MNLESPEHRVPPGVRTWEEHCTALWLENVRRIVSRKGGTSR